MNATCRLPEGGRVDRGAAVSFTFNGETYQGLRGDTLASALLANGVHQVTTSIKLGTAVCQMSARTPVRASSPTAPTRPATTRSTRTVTSWSSAPDRPGWRRP